MRLNNRLNDIRQILLGALFANSVSYLMFERYRSGGSRNDPPSIKTQPSPISLKPSSCSLVAHDDPERQGTDEIVRPMSQLLCLLCLPSGVQYFLLASAQHLKAPEESTTV